MAIVIFKHLTSAGLQFALGEIPHSVAMRAESREDDTLMNFRFDNVQGVRGEMVLQLA